MMERFRLRLPEMGAIWAWIWLLILFTPLAALSLAIAALFLALAWRLLLWGAGG